MDSLQSAAMESLRHPGLCNGRTDTGDAGDCAAGTEGAWKLYLSHKSLEDSAEECAARCARCLNCRYVSVSPTECHWYRQCDTTNLVKVTDIRGGSFMTARAPKPVAAPAPPPFSHSQYMAARADYRTWLAVGVIVAPGKRLRFSDYRAHAPLPPSVSWRFVSTDTRHEQDARVVVVPCRDGDFWPGHRATTQQWACICKTAHWFRSALQLFPRAHFIAKTEDDSILFDARLLAELRHASATSSTTSEGGGDSDVSTLVASGTSDGAAPLLWLGLYQWSVGHESSGEFCGEGDRLLHQQWPCTPAQPNQLISPFASGGLDVRSRRLAEALTSCEAPWSYLQRLEESFKADGTRPVDGCQCDSTYGYLLALCLAPLAANVTALHLTKHKFHSPPPTRHTTVLHPVKDGYKAAEAFDVRHANPWNWSSGAAMAPLRFSLLLRDIHHAGGHASKEASGWRERPELSREHGHLHELDDAATPQDVTTSPQLHAMARVGWVPEEPHYIEQFERRQREGAFAKGGERVCRKGLPCVTMHHG